MGYREDRDALRSQRDALRAQIAATEGDGALDARRELDDVVRRLAALGRTALPLAAALRLGVSCPAQFETMLGTGRARQCGICDEEVWNLDGLDDGEVEAFLAERRAQRPCLVVRARRDGHYQSGPCAPGEARAARRAGAAIVVAAVVLGAIVTIAVRGRATTEPMPSPMRGPGGAPIFASVASTSATSIEDVVAGPLPERAPRRRSALTLEVESDAAGVADLVRPMLELRREAFRRCHETELRRHTSLEGHVRVAASVRDSGTVRVERDVDVDARLVPIARCFERLVRGLRLGYGDVQPAAFDVVLDFAPEPSS